jgi:hypothetical protein
MAQFDAHQRWRLESKKANGALRNWLNAVASKKEYIERVKMVVEHLHKCTATHSATVPVHEVFLGETVWQGDVEVFDIKGHPKAKRAYGWSHMDGAKDERTRFVAVLEIPPVESAETAVRLQIVKDAKGKK